MQSQLDQFKRRTVAELSHRLDRGQIDRGEFDRRVTLAREAESPGDLKALLIDLEPGDPHAPQAHERAPMPVRHDGDARERELVLALLSGSVRAGHWEPPESVHAVAIMGGIDLDFRAASLLEGETEVSALAIMGGIRILVPPDVNVAVHGFGLMGAFSQVENRAQIPGAPRIRVKGLALMGGVEVKVVAAGAPVDDE